MFFSLLHAKYTNIESIRRWDTAHLLNLRHVMIVRSLSLLHRFNGRFGEEITC